jgi:enoyl-CoA hydratase/carnithine racemase
MTEQIQVRQEGAVEIIAFANPPKNFITHRMLRELHGELLRLREDSAVRAVVLTGGLKDSFITHYDVSELIEYARRSPKTSERVNRWIARLMDGLLRQAHRHPGLDRLLIRALSGRSPAEQGIYFWGRCLDLLDTLPKPVIAAINGLSLGGGCELALACDFRFMAKGAHYRIGLPEVLVGIIPGGTGTPLRLPRVVGEGKALEMLLTGKLYSTEEAEAMGLIHRAVEPEELMPVAMELAHRLARRAPAAVAAVKRDVRLGSRLAYPQGRVVDLAAAGAVMGTQDALAGMSRYVEDLVNKYDGLELARMLEDVKILDEGRLYEYQGK